jgi:hypothetical protein
MVRISVLLALECLDVPIAALIGVIDDPNVFPLALGPSNAGHSEQQGRGFGQTIVTQHLAHRDVVIIFGTSY